MISHRNSVEWRYSDKLARREAISERNDLKTARSGTTSNRAMISLNTVTNILDSVQSIVIEALTGPHKQTTYCLNTITSISIYTLSDLGVLSNLIGSLSLANEH